MPLDARAFCYATSMRIEKFPDKREFRRGHAEKIDPNWVFSPISRYLAAWMTLRGLPQPRVEVRLTRVEERVCLMCDSDFANLNARKWFARGECGRQA